MQTKKDILLIAYFFPPIKGIGVFRSYYIAQFSKNYFDKIHIVTTSNQAILPQESLNLEGFNIKKAFTFDYRTLLSLRSSETVFVEESKKQSFFFKILTKLNRSFPFNLLWGEGGFFYILHSFFLTFRLIRQNNITTVYTSFSPYSDHVVAYLLKIFFPKIIWVADFRDLHVEPHYDLVYWKRFQHRCNRFILKKANMVTTVSDGLGKHLKQYHPNIYVFKNGISPNNFKFEIPNSKLTPPQYFSKFTIAYTGSMFGDERNPSLFLEVIKDFVEKKVFSKDNFQIVYAGKDTAIWQNWVKKYDLEDFFTSKGMVSLAESQNIQRNSSINLLLTSATKEWTGVMTGKIYEYLAAQRPILILIDGTQDIEYEDFINDLNAGLVGYNSHSYEEVKNFIYAKFEEWQKEGSVKPTIREEKLKEMTWEKVIEKLYCHIENERLQITVARLN